ncbi:MAG: xylose isomerase [Paenibacillaceae bacterium]|jgi:sugar phosphate isomerase/epimerase|nr:xylose isomerase [Paenibacillaceae bacterium]
MTDKEHYSFSTCWNIKRHSAGRDMIEEIRSLGFRRVELNYNVTQAHLDTIEPMIERGEIGISSVHNVFPFIADKDYDTDSVLLGFEERDKRKRAVELLIRSMEYADRYGAEAVVVHPGEVPFAYNIDKELKELYQRSGRESEPYQALWKQMMERREQLSPAYVERIVHSLEEACNHAVKKGWRVAVGIETRSRCYQIPTLTEAKSICDALRGSPVGLWYDIGHAMMMERMGLYPNLEQLPQMLPYICGVHIHETLELSDHWCPYVHSGEAGSFDPYLPAVRAAGIRVYELKGKCEPHEIEASHRALLARLQA